MDNLVGLFGILVPLSAIVLGIGLAFWSIYWNHQKRQLQYRERQLMIEKGMTPQDIAASWRDDEAAFRKLREKYLLY